MPPPSPLPKRHGLSAAWVRTPDRDSANPKPWGTMREWLESKLGVHVDVASFLAGERFVYQTGDTVFGDDDYRANTFVWFHRDLRQEAVVPGSIDILYQDARLVVIDKPPFLSTIPRGRHVLQSVIVRMRQQLGLPELAPVHRLDRVTSGVLALTTERRWRAPYQLAFQHQQVDKTYLAAAPLPPADLRFPLTVRNHLRKDRGIPQVRVVADAEPNAISHVNIAEIHDDYAIYRLTPVTGKTHQLRQHLASIGLPILDDPLYPEALDVAVDDFSRPLQLLAQRLRFVDPVDHTERDFQSQRTLLLKT